MRRDACIDITRSKKLESSSEWESEVLRRNTASSDGSSLEGLFRLANSQDFMQD